MRGVCGQSNVDGKIGKIRKKVKKSLRIADFEPILRVEMLAELLFGCIIP